MKVVIDNEEMKVVIDGEKYVSISKIEQRLHKRFLEEMKYCDSNEEMHGIEIADAIMFSTLDMERK